MLAQTLEVKAAIPYLALLRLLAEAVVQKGLFRDRTIIPAVLAEAVEEQQTLELLALAIPRLQVRHKAIMAGRQVQAETVAQAAVAVLVLSAVHRLEMLAVQAVMAPPLQLVVRP